MHLGHFVIQVLLCLLHLDVYKRQELDHEISIDEDMLNHIDRYEPSSVAKLKDALQQAKDVKKTAKN